ncbi:MAG: hypothetical protein KDD02_22050, partial [Phaeodactylibacter sp.]|nr:hypothetical protein [Phaeodactylibacter sp.]
LKIKAHPAPMDSGFHALQDNELTLVLDNQSSLPFTLDSSDMIVLALSRSILDPDGISEISVKEAGWKIIDRSELDSSGSKIFLRLQPEQPLSVSDELQLTLSQLKAGGPTLGKVEAWLSTGQGSLEFPPHLLAVLAAPTTERSRSLTTPHIEVQVNTHQEIVKQGVLYRPGSSQEYRILNQVDLYIQLGEGLSGESEAIAAASRPTLLVAFSSDQDVPDEEGGEGAIAWLHSDNEDSWDLRLLNEAGANQTWELQLRQGESVPSGLKIHFDNIIAGAEEEETELAVAWTGFPNQADGLASVPIQVRTATPSILNFQVDDLHPAYGQKVEFSWKTFGGGQPELWILNEKGEETEQVFLPDPDGAAGEAWGLFRTGYAWYLPQEPFMQFRLKIWNAEGTEEAVSSTIHLQAHSYSLPELLSFDIRNQHWYIDPYSGATVIFSREEHPEVELQWSASRPEVIREYRLEGPDGQLLAINPPGQFSCRIRLGHPGVHTLIAVSRKEGLPESRMRMDLRPFFTEHLKGQQFRFEQEAADLNAVSFLEKPGSRNSGWTLHLRSIRQVCQLEFLTNGNIQYSQLPEDFQWEIQPNKPSGVIDRELDVLADHPPLQHFIQSSDWELLPGRLLRLHLPEGQKVDFRWQSDLAPFGWEPVSEMQPIPLKLYLSFSRYYRRDEDLLPLEVIQAEVNMEIPWPAPIHLWRQGTEDKGLAESLQLEFNLQNPIAEKPSSLYVGHANHLNIVLANPGRNTLALRPEDAVQIRIPQDVLLGSPFQDILLAEKDWRLAEVTAPDQNSSSYIFGLKPRHTIRMNGEPLELTLTGLRPQRSGLAEFQMSLTISGKEFPAQRQMVAMHHWPEWQQPLEQALSLDLSINDDQEYVEQGLLYLSGGEHEPPLSNQMRLRITGKDEDGIPLAHSWSEMNPPRFVLTFPYGNTADDLTQQSPSGKNGEEAPASAWAIKAKLAEGMQKDWTLRRIGTQAPQWIIEPKLENLALFTEENPTLEIIFQNLISRNPEGMTAMHLLADGFPGYDPMLLAIPVKKVLPAPQVIDFSPATAELEPGKSVQLQWTSFAAARLNLFILRAGNEQESDNGRSREIKGLVEKKAYPVSFRPHRPSLFYKGTDNYYPDTNEKVVFELQAEKGVL